ncbi:uncharacterized protein BJ212DRAFT_1305295 [Suillus subaureus]|uniref:Uncharacterized protein n=1 Tax=Suillus subaureus TaxID=48587 RepID=A0A9P7DQN2_9AGAM|nr:uncharacterized protein BJ212DRAFT_1305295 [Suillus subaureus]KAG1800506.1 hypothetical protein BJ212DRAFT_1305295 [Suillus subaureus]
MDGSILQHGTTEHDSQTTRHGTPYNNGTHPFPYGESPLLTSCPNSRADYQPWNNVARGLYGMNQGSPHEQSANTNSLMMVQIVSQMQHLMENSNQQTGQNMIINDCLNKVLECPDAVEQKMVEMAENEQLNKGKDMTGKNISNMHPVLKPLENGEPCEQKEGSPKVWYLNWLGKIDSNVNTPFIQAVMDHVWNDDMV